MSKYNLGDVIKVKYPGGHKAKYTILSVIDHEFGAVSGQSIERSPLFKPHGIRLRPLFIPPYRSYKIKGNGSSPHWQPTDKELDAIYVKHVKVGGL